MTMTNSFGKVIRTPETSDETYGKMMAWGNTIGKTTITCKDTPGFVVNRLLGPYLNEALKMLERGEYTQSTICVRRYSLSFALF
jgi:3-hydroxyacyl-CoA dehydrogenase